MNDEESKKMVYKAREVAHKIALEFLQSQNDILKRLEHFIEIENPCTKDEVDSFFYTVYNSLDHRLIAQSISNQVDRIKENTDEEHYIDLLDYFKQSIQEDWKAITGEEF